tara:strand:- start:300 stop:575 length:276 start_codon:yes stop_codon:yes gene_type:complete
MNKKTLMRFLRQTNALSQEDNVYYAEKAFIINQVMNFVISNKLTEEKLIKILTLVNKYVNNEIVLSFQDGKIIMEFIDEEEENDDILANSL